MPLGRVRRIGQQHRYKQEQQHSKDMTKAVDPADDVSNYDRLDCCCAMSRPIAEAFRLGGE